VSPADPGLLELFARSLDVVQETITRFKLAAQPPDLIIRIPRNVCAFYEFHRAEEVIELGRERHAGCADALAAAEAARGLNRQRVVTRVACGQRQMNGGSAGKPTGPLRINIGSNGDAGLLAGRWI
jgi:hypothetical protein